MPHVIHCFWSVVGYSIELRVQSPAFRAALKALERLATQCAPGFDAAYARAVARYGADDPELLRVATFASFMRDDA